MSFLISGFFFNSYLNQNSIPEVDLSFIIIIYLTMYSLLSSIIYQIVRRNFQNRLNVKLKSMLHPESIKFAKDLDFYIDKPDMVTTAILWSIPIMTFLYRIVPEILKVI